MMMADVFWGGGGRDAGVGLARGGDILEKQNDGVMKMGKCLFREK